MARLAGDSAPRVGSRQYRAQMRQARRPTRPLRRALRTVQPRPLPEPAVPHGYGRQSRQGRHPNRTTVNPRGRLVPNTPHQRQVNARARSPLFADQPHGGGAFVRGGKRYIVRSKTGWGLGPDRIATLRDQARLLHIGLDPTRLPSHRLSALRELRVRYGIPVTNRDYVSALTPRKPVHKGSFLHKALGAIGHTLGFGQVGPRKVGPSGYPVERLVKDIARADRQRYLTNQTGAILNQNQQGVQTSGFDPTSAILGIANLSTKVAHSVANVHVPLSAADNPTYKLGGGDKVARNALQDVVDLPAQTLASTWLSVHDPGSVLKSTEDTLKHPGRSFKQHPVATALILRGLEGGVSRGLGIAGRATGRLPIDRTPLHLVGGAHAPRTFSRGLFEQLAQMGLDKRAIRRGRGLTTTGRKFEPDLIGPQHPLHSIQATRRQMYGVFGHNGLLGRRLDIEFGKNMTMTRNAREQAYGEMFRKDVAPKDRSAARYGTLHHGADMVPLILEGAVKTGNEHRALSRQSLEEDLVAERKRITHQIATNDNLTPAEVADAQANLEIVNRLLKDKKFLDNPHEAIRAAEHYIATLEPLTAERIARGDLNAEPAIRRVLLPFAQRELGLNYVEKPGKAPAYRRYLALRENERAAQRRAGETGRAAARADREHQQAVRREAKERGRAEYQSRQADRAVLRDNEDFRAAENERRSATHELAAARKGYGNAARNPKMYSERELAAKVTRLRAAERRAKRAAEDYRAVRDRVLREAETSPRSPLGRRPVGSLSRLERARGAVHEAERRRVRARQAHDEARKAHREARQEANQARVPQSKRELRGQFLDEHGNAVSNEAVLEAFRKQGGNPHHLGYVMQRPSSHYESGSDFYQGNVFGRPGAENRTYKGKLAPAAAYRRDYEVLARKLAREAVKVEKHRGTDSLANQFGVVRPDGSYFDSLRAAEREADAQLAATGIHYTAVVAGRKAAMDQLRGGLSPSELQHDFTPAKEGDHNIMLMPSDVLARGEAHEKVSLKPPVLRAQQAWLQRFRHVVLPTSPKWAFGNMGEMELRIALHDPTLGLASIPRGRAFLHRLGALEANGVNVGERLVDELKGASAAGQFGAQRTYDIRRPPNNEILKAIHTLRNAGLGPGQELGPKGVVDAWEAYKRAVFWANGHMEDGIFYSALDRFSRQRISVLSKDWFKALGAQGDALEEVARGFLHPDGKINYDKISEFAKMLDDMRGRYANLSPSARAVVSLYTPFAPWYVNALYFVLVTLPKTHPVKTALLASMFKATEQKRKALGLTHFPDVGGPKPVQAFLQGAVPTGKGLARYNQFTPFGAFGDPLETASNLVLPQYGFLDNFAGLNFKLQPLKDIHGNAPDIITRFLIAMNTAAESMVPFLRQGRQLRELGGSSADTSSIIRPQVKPGSKRGIGYAAQKTFNPLFITGNTSKGGSGSGWGKSSSSTSGSGWGSSSSSSGKTGWGG